MKKERTSEEYAALANAYANMLTAKFSKEELARMAAIDYVTKVLQEDMHDIHQPILDEMQKKLEKKEALLEKLRESNKKAVAEREADLRNKLHDAPKQLASRGAQARAAAAQCLFEKKIEFLFKQHDITHTEGLARRLDREFGIKGRQPEEDEPASRASKDVVRDWNRFRSASKTEEISPVTHQKGEATN